ncbi:MAG TPA: nicotinate-nucleotide adenylyltransferase [Terriglobia bacterium]|nr:nicotinate-nucleotide adenylyltransferase [Terriglobia bacterium]
MNIALFGGTFDPIHAGHLRAAQAAARKFRLDKILFIPSGNPPHKPTNHLTAFHHRFSMVTLACAGKPGFVPSLLEAPKADGRLHYSITTTERVKRSLGSKDHLYFLLGLDAFLDLPHWKEYQRLLDLVDFIVVSRPGFSNTHFSRIVPPSLLRQGKSKRVPDTIPLRESTLHILRGLDVPAASHKIRASIYAGRRVAGLVPPLVEEYIRKEGLYRPGRIAKTQ